MQKLLARVVEAHIELRAAERAIKTHVAEPLGLDLITEGDHHELARVRYSVGQR